MPPKRPTNKVEVVRPDGQRVCLYEPQPHQLKFHQSNIPNLLALGTRNTGKSTTLRWDAIIRCLTYPGFKALILRRKLTDLRKSHLNFIGAESKALGGRFRETTFDVKWSNGSILQFSHCEDERAVDDYLSSEWDYGGFDELSTFRLEYFLKIGASVRTTTNKPYKALVRACSNPLGPGADWMKAWFVDRVVDYGEFPDYNPDDFEMQFSTLEDNKYVNRDDYEKRLKNMPSHVRRAWLYGEFVGEGAYFDDFHRTKDGKPWHVIPHLPTWKGQPLSMCPWISIFRAIDWGYDPDPAVCLWIALLPNRHAIVFKEKKWQRTLAADVARDIVRESQGMRVVESFCDPTMFVKTGTVEYSIGEIFDRHGVPLTPAQNSRELYGYAIHESLNTLVDEHPSLQIVERACPELIRTIPLMQRNSTDARKLADGYDHYVVSLAYYCMGKAGPAYDPEQGLGGLPRWMRPKSQSRMIDLYV